MSQPLSISSEFNIEKEVENSKEDEINEEEEEEEEKNSSNIHSNTNNNSHTQSNNNSNNDFKKNFLIYKNNNNNNDNIPQDKKKEDTNDNNQRKKQKLMVMVIPKLNKDLPLPLNTLYFFLELFSYENGLKQLTDEDNKLVFYLLDLNWLNELKTFYNYKCIEFIIKKELKENKNFLTKINDLLNTSNPSKLYEDYKLINKFNNIIINPKRIKKKFVDKEELFAPKKIEYNVININKNIVSSKLDYLDYFTYYPKCVLINERMRNILYLEYKYLKFSQFQKGDITLVDDKIYIKLTNKIIEVCSFEKKNLIITPIYILYYFDISNVPFWENVLYEKDFLKDYLLKRIYKDNKHIQCMLDPYNKEYIGYSINLNIKYEGEPIKEYSPINENISDINAIPTEDELLNALDEISKYNMNGYYNNKFEENEKKNKEDDSENKFMLKMKLMRKKKEEELFNKKKKYIETINRFMDTKKSGDSEYVNVNGEIIGFIQGDDLTRNGEGFKSSTGSDYISSIEDDNNNKKNNRPLINSNNNINNKKNNNKKIKNNSNKNIINEEDSNNVSSNNTEKYMNKIKEEQEEESENDYNGEIIMQNKKYQKQFNKIQDNDYNENYQEEYNNIDNIDNTDNIDNSDNNNVNDKEKKCNIF